MASLTTTLGKYMNGELEKEKILGKKKDRAAFTHAWVMGPKGCKNSRPQREETFINWKGEGIRAKRRG